MFDAPGTQTKLSGPIVSARGEFEDNHWEVVAKLPKTDGAGNLILPLGYHFDFDNTITD